jgi:hypothetical protein
MKAGKHSELESFWRAHLDGWRRSDLNQREYCELHGPPGAGARAANRIDDVLPWNWIASNVEI